MAVLAALAFVASLAYTAWTYAVTWSAPHATQFSPAALLVDVGLLILFAGHHSVTARQPVKAWLAALLGGRSVRTAFVWIASLLLALVCAVWQPVGGVVYRASGLQAVVHGAVQLAGVWLVGGSVRRIDPLELAGLRAAAPTSLQKSGPYGLVRHPLYLGWILIVFGAATMTADRLAFAAITSAYLLVAIPWEEHSLQHAFGERYAEYARSVRWRVIPYVY